MLKQKRKDKKFTQEELALLLNVSKSTVCQLEKHPELCNPNVKLILKLSSCLDIEHLQIYLYFVDKIKSSLSNKH
ncbi:UNVERIFIED_ORG: transcriptional regulator [Clostridium botulinum]|uniref:helix-turn-helix domain-containing protein n=1 Tax=Clostridium botulinum TaxID=1491 RepID=UPI000773F15E|nr:helix-turn-helix transcriptional regulator [Clostridium botulinum]MBN1042345.1 XRE family transcriptional regulator [Clostridium botulinum]NFG36583.1 helix-turn-helix transcriptional regulator [Clostridium botulinum]NFM02553.1 helix-turn-helix transcriptional regulator [Clostridium botulinum]NFN81187.1 helix-turn-helix transcriptional regulator [Clostridium botulinum]NFO31503.1 helix-turn-helix transcriptional regulator [Clostridium botulinum]